MTRGELIALTFLGGLAIVFLLNGGRMSPMPDWPHAVEVQR